MKLRLLALSAVLLTLSYAAPRSWAQDQGNSAPSASDSTPKSTAPAPVNPADPDKVRHEGGKEDVDAVGNRNVGCKTGMGNWYGVEKQIAMGKQYAQQVESSVKLIQDPVVTEYVNRVGQNLVRNSDAQVPFTIKVIDSDDINAFALPGGFFYVNSGLILAADEEATFLHFSRGFESEADYLGLQYMYKSGYDPQAFIAFFEKVQAQEKKKPGTLAKAFSTHPQTPDRIAKSQEEIATILPARAQYTVSTSEFDDVKSRLAAIENRHKILDKKEDKNKPTLRRTSTPDKNGSDDKGTNDDDRPTLKRRDDSSSN
jgi:predicted Zn-dependent protease